MVDEIAAQNLKTQGMYVWDAIKRGQLDILLQKLDQEAFPIDHPVTCTGLTAFAFACSRSNRPDILQALLDRGANPFFTDDTGKTPLHHAANSGNLRAIEIILSLPQKNIEAQTNGFETPLMCAVRGNSVNSVACLLNAGCNPFIKNGLEETALNIAQTLRSAYIVPGGGQE